MNKVFKNDESNLHKGHRQRLKKKYLTVGVAGMNDEEILELLLFYALPQRDTADLAHMLFSRYGSLSAILDAPLSRLTEMHGINEHTAIFFSLLTDLVKMYRMDKISPDNLYEDKHKIAKYMMAFLGSDRKERTALICFDRQRRLIGSEVIFDHDVDQLTPAHIRAIASRALGLGAYAVALGHNHTSGVAEPSENDIIATNALKMALGGIDITLIEHIIVSDENYVLVNDFIDRNGYENL